MRCRINCLEPGPLEPPGWEGHPEPWSHKTEQTTTGSTLIQPPVAQFRGGMKSSQSRPCCEIWINTVRYFPPELSNLLFSPRVKKVKLRPHLCSGASDGGVHLALLPGADGCQRRQVGFSVADLRQLLLLHLGRER